MSQKQDIKSLSERIKKIDGEIKFLSTQDNYMAANKKFLLKKELAQLKNRFRIIATDRGI